MKIAPDKKYAAKLLKQIMDDVLADEGRDKSKWHVSDMVFPLAAYFRERFGYEDDEEDVGFYFTGRAFHHELQRIIGISKSEVKGELLNVIGTADYLDEVMLEIKTSRKWTVPEVPPGHYVHQGGCYCAIFNRESILLVVIYPTAGRTWKGDKASTIVVKVWRVTFTDKDIANIKEDMKLTVAHLEKALKTKDPSALPPCPDWKIKKMLEKAGKGKLFKLWKGGYDEKYAAEHPFNYVEMEK